MKKITVSIKIGIIGKVVTHESWLFIYLYSTILCNW